MLLPILSGSKYKTFSEQREMNYESKRQLINMRLYDFYSLYSNTVLSAYISIDEISNNSRRARRGVEPLVYTMLDEDYYDVSTCEKQLWIL